MIRLLLCFLFPCALASGQIVKTDASPADRLFSEGRFDEAYSLFSQDLNPKDAHTLQRLAQIALYENRFGDAERWAHSLLELDPAAVTAKSLLAQIYFRQDRFAESAPFVRALGADAEADQLLKLAVKGPYKTRPGFKRVEVPFIQVDPLPVVEVSVNGSRPLRFFIDTGGAEVIVDSGRASELGLSAAGKAMGTFAGGKQAAMQETAIDSLSLSGFEVKNVPAVTLDLSQLGRILGGRIDGCIGTVFLYHFLSTIDYPHKRLVLRPLTSRFDEKGKTIRIPFWMAGNHTMLAWGHVNNAPEHLFFIDTGLAGAAINAPKSTLDEAGVAFAPGLGGVGVGGGGEVQVQNFYVDSLSLGPVTGHHLLGSLYRRVCDGKELSVPDRGAHLARLF